MERSSGPDTTPTLLATLKNVHEARVVAQILEGEGIPSLVKKNKASRYDLLYDTFGLNVGACDLYVPAHMIEAARGLLQESREAAELLEAGLLPDEEDSAADEDAAAT